MSDTDHADTIRRYVAGYVLSEDDVSALAGVVAERRQAIDEWDAAQKLAMQNERRYLNAADRADAMRARCEQAIDALIAVLLSLGEQK